MILGWNSFQDRKSKNLHQFWWNKVCILPFKIFSEHKKQITFTNIYNWWLNVLWTDVVHPYSPGLSRLGWFWFDFPFPLHIGSMFHGSCHWRQYFHLGPCLFLHETNKFLFYNFVNLKELLLNLHFSSSSLAARLQLSKLGQLL